MEKKDIIWLIKSLSKAYLENKIDKNYYASIVESIIGLNINLLPELMDFADFLAQYHHPKDMPELYSDEELIEQIKKLFGL